MSALSVVEVIDLVEPCTFTVAADWNGNAWEPERCGRPAVDDEDEPRCADHVEFLDRESQPEFNGAFR